MTASSFILIAATVMILLMTTAVEEVQPMSPWARRWGRSVGSLVPNGRARRVYFSEKASQPINDDAINLSNLESEQVIRDQFPRRPY